MFSDQNAAKYFQLWCCSSVDLYFFLIVCIFYIFCILFPGNPYFPRCSKIFAYLAKPNWDNWQGRPFSLSFQRNFPISFKPEVAKADLYWKMQRKTWYTILRVDAKHLAGQTWIWSISNLNFAGYTGSKNQVCFEIYFFSSL